MNANDPNEKKDSIKKGANRMGDSAKTNGESNGKHTYSSDPSDYSYGNKVSPNEPSPSNNSQSNRKENMKTDRDFRESNRTDDFYHYVKSNKQQTITYILLALGLLSLLIFDPLFGGLVIGMVAGYYFASEIVHYFRNFNQIFSGNNRIRSVVLGALLLGFFIAAPGIFIGAAIVALFRHVVQGPNRP